MLIFDYIYIKCQFYVFITVISEMRAAGLGFRCVRLKMLMSFKKKEIKYHVRETASALWYLT